MKRKIAIWILTIVSVLIVAAIAAGRIVSKVNAEKIMAVPEKAILAGDAATAVPGSLLKFQADLTLPYGCEVEKIVVVPPAGSVTAGTPEISTGWGWDRVCDQITFALRPLKTGTVSGGKLTLEISIPGQALAAFDIVIPEFSVALPSADAGVVLLAPEEKIVVEENNLRNYLIAGAIVVALGVVIWLLIRHRRRKRYLTAAEKVLAQLEILRRDAQEGKLDLDKGFVKLVDIVKDFIAENFQVELFSSTAEEFIRTIESRRESFHGEQREFFREFLHIADLVKFSGSCFDATALLSAIAGVKKLIRAIAFPFEADDEALK